LIQIFVPECFALPHHQAGRSIRKHPIQDYPINSRPNASPLQNSCMG
jgi:hypothetical protein